MCLVAAMSVWRSNLAETLLEAEGSVAHDRLYFNPLQQLET